MRFHGILRRDCKRRQSNGVRRDENSLQANAVERRMTQIGLFFELDRGIDVGQTEDSAIEAAAKAKCMSDGEPMCGIRTHCRRHHAIQVGSPENHAPEPAYRMALNGCGYENGLAGIVFAYGMHSQCLAVAQNVSACALSQISASDNRRQVRAVRAVLGEPRMALNVVGLSRGAVAPVSRLFCTLLTVRNMQVAAL